MDTRVAEELAAVTDGNPLAMLELGHALSPEQRRGTEPLGAVVLLSDALATHVRADRAVVDGGAAVPLARGRRGTRARTPRVDAVARAVGVDDRQVARVFTTGVLTCDDDRVEYTRDACLPGPCASPDRLTSWPSKSASPPCSAPRRTAPPRSRPTARPSVRSSRSWSTTYPGLKGQLIDGDGALHKFVNVYVERRRHPLPRPARHQGRRRRRHLDPPRGRRGLSPLAPATHSREAGVDPRPDREHPARRSARVESEPRVSASTPSSRARTPAGPRRTASRSKMVELAEKQTACSSRAPRSSSRRRATPASGSRSSPSCAATSCGSSCRRT